MEYVTRRKCTWETEYTVVIYRYNIYVIESLLSCNGEKMHSGLSKEGYCEGPELYDLARDVE